MYAGYNISFNKALLAVNVTQRINVAINENQFNMDLTPLRSYIGVSQSATDNNSYVHFLDAEIIDKLIAYDDAFDSIKNS